MPGVLVWWAVLVCSKARLFLTLALIISKGYHLLVGHASSKSPELVTVCTWRHAIVAAEQPAERAQTFEADRQANLGNWVIGMG